MTAKPTATTWVMRDPDGQMVPIKVTDMTDQHLFRWIRYFRKKWRDGGYQGSDAALDGIIKREMVTAPAIYVEASKRGVFKPPLPDPVMDERGTKPADATPGARRITLEDDE